MTYTCTICQAINHVRRLHCQFCGAVPKHLSIGLPAKTVAAIGCDRQENHRAVRVNLRTVTADYYAAGAEE